MIHFSHLTQKWAHRKRSFLKWLINVCEAHKIIANTYWAMYTPGTVLHVLNVRPLVIPSTTMWGNPKASANCESQPARKLEGAMSTQDRPHSTLTSIASSGILKIFHRFKNLLAGLTELIEHCYSRKRTQIKISQDNEDMEKGLGGVQSGLQFSFPLRAMDGISPSQRHCVTKCTEYCQPGKLRWAFGVQSFYWGSITYFLHGWLLVSSPFSEEELIPSSLKPPS